MDSAETGTTAEVPKNGERKGRYVTRFSPNTSLLGPGVEFRLRFPKGSYKEHIQGEWQPWPLPTLQDAGAALLDSLAWPTLSVSAFSFRLTFLFISSFFTTVLSQGATSLCAVQGATYLSMPLEAGSLPPEWRVTESTEVRCYSQTYRHDQIRTRHPNKDISRSLHPRLGNPKCRLSHKATLHLLTAAHCWGS